MKDEKERCTEGVHGEGQRAETACRLATTMRQVNKDTRRLEDKKTRRQGDNVSHPHLSLIPKIKYNAIYII